MTDPRERERPPDGREADENGEERAEEERELDETGRESFPGSDPPGLGGPGL